MTGANTPAVATPDSNNPTAPVPGANSFTEAQAKADRDGGLIGVANLKLDDKGIWQASATKDGKSVNVGLKSKSRLSPSRVNPAELEQGRPNRT